ncbi:MAG: hypothetical protein CFH41_00423 [Alphaproteobacteria bacterium MarineAlpha11_Bin1]|nr:MAG: hypothetical protein CFH41_00423 [Alphaproteobacteria bacterium MarineAlpha11_Bin1]
MKPEPRTILLELLEMYGNPHSRKHISSDMKRYIRSIRTDLILYGTLSQRQFKAIRTFLVFETKGNVEQVKNFFEPCIRIGRAKRLSGSPKSISETPVNTLERFF